MTVRSTVIFAALLCAAHLFEGSHAVQRPKHLQSRGQMPSQKLSDDVSMLTVFMTACSAAADWQSLGLYYTFLRYIKPLVTVTPSQA